MSFFPYGQYLPTNIGLNIFISVQVHSVQFSIIQTLGFEQKQELNPLYTGNMGTFTNSAHFIRVYTVFHSKKDLQTKLQGFSL